MANGTNRPLRVFLSHASEDKTAVKALRNLLGDSNIDVWFDEERILPGQNWESEIRKGLEAADIVVICLSKNLVNKEGYIHRELRMALRKADEKPEDTIYLVPLKLEECDTPSNFGHLQWANLFYKNGEFEKSVLNKLLLALRKRAESLGLLWGSASQATQSEKTANPESNDGLAGNQSYQPRTIKIETESRENKNTQSSNTLETKEIKDPFQNFSSLLQNKQIDNITIKNNSTLVVYVIDASGTMGKPLKGKTRLDFVRSAVNEAIKGMANYSTVHAEEQPIFRIAVFTYSDSTHNILNGIKPINEIVATGLPKFQLMSKTNTALAFIEIEKLLRQELPDIQNAPPPIICHITDGKFTGENPLTIAQRIMGMSVKQGNVLIENLYICDDMLIEPIKEIRKWNGLTDKFELQNEYAQLLFEMSSHIPESYYQTLKSSGYNIAKNAKMLFPGEYSKEFAKIFLPE